jgi:hypothetical protein
LSEPGGLRSVKSFTEISHTALGGPDGCGIHGPSSGQSLILTVAVGRHREGGCGVPEPFRDDGRGHTAKMHQSAAGVPSVMEPDGRQPGRFGQIPELVGVPLRPVWMAQLVHHDVSP